jgi:hypothetical protein
LEWVVIIIVIVITSIINARQNDLPETKGKKTGLINFTIVTIKTYSLQLHISAKRAG